MRALISFAFLTAVSSAAWAGQVDRSQVTLGALADSVDVIVVATVRASGARGTELSVVTRVKGRVGERIQLPASKAVTLEPGQRALFFLRRDAQGKLSAPATVWDRVVLADAASERAVVTAVRARLPRIGEAGGGLRTSLFAQLGSPVARVREDAALDLLRFRDLQATAQELGSLAQAIQNDVDARGLLQLAARLPDRRLLTPLLDAARRGKAEATRRMAGKALASIDRGAALETFRGQLTATDGKQAVAAAQGLGALGCEAAAKALVAALRDGRTSVRAAAMRALAACKASPAAAKALEAAVLEAASPAEARRALAALTRANGGKALARLAEQLRDPKLRALAARLRRNPARVARELLRQDRLAARKAAAAAAKENASK